MQYVVTQLQATKIYIKNERKKELPQKHIFYKMYGYTCLTPSKRKQCFFVFPIVFLNIKFLPLHSFYLLTQ